MNEWPWWAQLIMDTVNGVIIFVAAYLGAKAALQKFEGRAITRVLKEVSILERIHARVDGPTNRD